MRYKLKAYPIKSSQRGGQGDKDQGEKEKRCSVAPLFWHSKYSGILAVGAKASSDLSYP